MIRQYIKLFLESNRESEDNSSNDSSFKDLLDSMIDPVSQEATDQIKKDNTPVNNSNKVKKNNINTTINSNQHNHNSNELELFMRRRTNRDRSN